MKTIQSRMAEACLRFRERGVRHIVFGDIFLRDLRAYRERNLAELDMLAVFPLWDIDTRQLAARFVKEGFRAITVCIDPKKLDSSFAGRQLDASFFEDLPAGVDPCGENGEFHTFVFDGPLFRSPVRIRTGRIVERDCFVFLRLDSERRSTVFAEITTIGQAQILRAAISPHSRSSLEFHPVGAMALFEQFRPFVLPRRSRPR